MKALHGAMAISLLFLFYIPFSSSTERIEIAGNLNMGGIYSVRNFSSSYAKCGTAIFPENAILTEAHRFSVDYVNDRFFQSSPLNFGTVVIDSCSSDVIGLQRSAEFVEQKQPGFCFEGSFQSNPVASRAVFLANGFMSSGVAKNLDFLLQAFCMPLVCAGCSSAEFDNTDLFRFLLRIYPSDKYQAQALAGILCHLNWTHISVLYEDSTYGVGLFTKLKAALGDRICLENFHIVSVEETPEWSEIKVMLTDNDSTTPRILVVLAQEIVAMEILTKLDQWGLAGRIQIVGSDGWSTMELPQGLNRIAENAITTEVSLEEFEPFRDYLQNVTLCTVHEPGVDQSPRNPWLAQLIEEQNNCSYNSSSINPCSGNETLSKSNFASALRKARLVFRSVYIAASAINDILTESCESTSNSDLCYNFTHILTGGLLHARMKNISYSLPEDEFHFFNGSNSGPPDYSIHVFNASQWLRIGNFSVHENGSSKMELASVTTADWIREEIANCTPVCGARGYVQRNRHDECCWSCVNCSGSYEIVKRVTDDQQDSCEECPLGEVPNANFDNCTKILFDDPIDVPTTEMVIVLGFSVFGCAICVGSLVLIVRNYKTPIVTAATGNLLPPLTITIFLLFATSVLNLPTSSSGICLAAWACTGILLAICHTITLMKMIRMVRPRWIHHSNFLSVHSSGFLMLCAFLLQAMVLLTWIVLRTPKISVKKLHRTTSYYYSCSATAEPHTLILFVIPFCYLTLSFYLSFRSLRHAFAYQVWQARFAVAGNLCLVVNYAVLGPLFLALEEDDVNQKSLLLLSILSITATVFWLTLLFPVVYLLLFRKSDNTSTFVTAKYVRTIRRRVGATLWVMEPVSRNSNPGLRSQSSGGS